MSPSAEATAIEPSCVRTKRQTEWLRPVGFGFVLAFASAPGQTFFISLSAGALRREFGLDHLEFSGLYTGATLVSAVSMLKLGELADRPRVGRTALWTLGSVSAACALMASAVHPFAVGLALVLLRLSGQGMLSHLAMTTLGRHFDNARGRALALASLGYPCAEGLLPFAVAWGLTVTTWRVVWLASGAVLLAVVMPLVWSLGQRRFDGIVSVDRSPSDRRDGGTTRGAVLKDPRFYLALPIVMLPGFVLTGVFFHQVHLADSRGWSLMQLAQLYPGYAISAVLSTLGAGWLVDRTSAWTLFSIFLIPLAGGLAVVGCSEALISGGMFYALAGVTTGCASILQGTLWPEMYGTKRLGEIRALAVTGLILSTAVAPVVVGAGLNAGLGMDDTLMVMLTIVVFANLVSIIGSWFPPFGTRLGSKR